VTEGIGNGYGFAPILVGRVEAARLLSISVPELDRLRRNGELVARRKGRRVLLTPAELQRYADTLCLHTNKCSIDVTPAT
jgi:excisionase family DNA binding protein